MSLLVPCPDFPLDENVTMGDFFSTRTLARIEVAEHDVDHSELAVGFMF